MKKLYREYKRKWQDMQLKKFDQNMRRLYKEELRVAPKTFSGWLSHCITPFPVREVID